MISGISEACKLCHGTIYPTNRVAFQVNDPDGSTTFFSTHGTCLVERFSFLEIPEGGVVGDWPALQDPRVQSWILKGSPRGTMRWCKDFINGATDGEREELMKYLKELQG